MKQAVISQLNKLNIKFYETSAKDFSTTRQIAWTGWQKIRARLKELATSGNDLRILDVGCGNARWAQFLATVWPEKKISYTGVDLSPALLAAAKISLAELPLIQSELLEQDLVETWLKSNQLTEPVWKESFDLIGLFGVLHHLPATDLRKFWLKQLASQLRPGGLLILTYWRFDREQGRFAKKMVKPNLVNLNAKELEPGDMILDWRQGGLNYRYCHLASELEIQANTTWLTENLPDVSLLSSFEADGKSGLLNHYQIWQKSF